MRCISMVAVALAVSAGAASAQQGMTPDLQAAKAGLERYQDPIAAVHDGYLSTLACVQYNTPVTEGDMQYVAGGMGVHFINMANVGPTLDPTKPQVLIYEPRGDSLKLVAAEWFMPSGIVNGEPPSIFGHQLQGPMEGHQPIMPPELHHYDLHVWLWKQNPAGMFSPTNPAVRCPARGYSFVEAPPHMAHDH